MAGFSNASYELDPDDESSLDDELDEEDEDDEDEDEESEDEESDDESDDDDDDEDTFLFRSEGRLAAAVGAGFLNSGRDSTSSSSALTLLPLLDTRSSSSRLGSSAGLIGPILFGDSESELDEPLMDRLLEARTSFRTAISFLT